MAQQRIHGEAGEMGQIGDLDTQQVVHVARHGIALDYFGPALHVAGEFTHGRVAAAHVLVQADGHIRQQAQPDFFGIDQGAVALDIAALFEPAHAPQAGAGRQRHAVGQFLVAEAAVALQFGQDSAICPIQVQFSHFYPRLIETEQYYCPLYASLQQICNLLPAYAAYNLRPRLEFPSRTNDETRSAAMRSEERLAGKEWVCTCRSWWSPYH